MDSYRSNDQNRTEIANIGKSVAIKGDVSGGEDLYLDGEVDGSIELHEHSLTVGPNGHVRANINAKQVIIHGRVDGNVFASDRVELRKSAVLSGDIATQRIVIEDGAYVIEDDNLVMMLFHEFQQALGRFKGSTLRQRRLNKRMIIVANLLVDFPAISRNRSA